MSEDQKLSRIKAAEATVTALSDQVVGSTVALGEFTTMLEAMRKTLEALTGYLSEARTELAILKTDDGVVIPLVSDEDIGELHEATSDLADKRADLENIADRYNERVESLTDIWSEFETAESVYNSAISTFEEVLDPIQSGLQSFLTDPNREDWIRTDKGVAFVEYASRFIGLHIPEATNVSEPAAVESEGIYTGDFDCGADVESVDSEPPEILCPKEPGAVDIAAA